MKQPDYQLLYSPETDEYIEFDSGDYYDLCDELKEQLIWLKWDDVTGEWYEWSWKLNLIGSDYASNYVEILTWIM